MKLILATFLTVCAFAKSYSQCDASFSYTLSNYYAQFTPADSSANKIHTWYYGDSTYNTYTYGFRSYEQPGVFEVKHVIYDTFTHCKDSATQTITISYIPECTADFYIQRRFPDMNTFYFQSVSYTWGTSITQYTWKVNGNVVGSDSYIEYTSTEGNMIVCLEIKTKSGCSSVYCDTISTYKKCNLNPDFTATPDKSNSRVIYFQPQRNDSLLQYRWLLNASQEMYTSNLFSEPGKYEITMYVTDSIHHCYDSTIKTITVQANCYDSLSVSYTYAPNPGLPNQITFTPSSNQPIANQLWQIYFVDSLLYSSAFTSGNSFTYTFSDTGYYRVSATVFTKNGCSKEVIEYIPIISVHNNSPRQSIVSYPNPANSYVVLPFTTATTETIKITVYNIMGKPVLERQETLLKGNNQIRIPITQLNKGQYFVSFFYNNKKQKSTFQKL